jgi:hypothetical protein
MTEEAIAKKIKASLIKNSGRGLVKGDMKWQSFIVDAKEGKTFQFTEQVWAKACSDALSHGPEFTPMILRVMPGGAMIACIPFSELDYLLTVGGNGDPVGW